MKLTKLFTGILLGVCTVLGMVAIYLLVASGFTRNWIFILLLPLVPFALLGVTTGWNLKKRYYLPLIPILICMVFLLVSARGSESPFTGITLLILLGVSYIPMLLTALVLHIIRKKRHE